MCLWADVEYGFQKLAMTRCSALDCGPQAESFHLDLDLGMICFEEMLHLRKWLFKMETIIF